MIFARLILAACVMIACNVAYAVPLSANGEWSYFDVDDLSANSHGVEWIDILSGDPLSFTFTIDSGFNGTLTVVDTVYAGDTFNIYNGATLLGPTSAVPVGIYPGVAGTFSADDAFADPSFSRATFTLGAGSYNISGVLDQSVLDAPGGLPLNSTSGGIRLSVSAVPEPESLALMLVGFGLIAVVLRRRKT